MQKFLNQHQNKISFDQLKNTYPVFHVHGMAFPVLFGYYNFRKLLCTNKVVILDGLICILDSKKNRLIYYDPNKQFDFSLVKSKSELLSIQDLGNIPGFKKSKVEEFIYNIDGIFNPSNYENAKDRARKLNYPVNLMKKNYFRSEELTSDNTQIAKDIHTRWVETKLADENTFRMTFGGAKYWNLIEEYILFYNNFFPAHIKLGIVNEQPFSVECDYIWGDCAFAMSSFNLFWEFPSNYSEGSRLMFFDELRKRGIKYFNYGFVLNKQLKNYKKHWPHETIYLYRYINY
jgi:hypothetical protein